MGSQAAVSPRLLARGFADWVERYGGRNGRSWRVERQRGTGGRRVSFPEHLGRAGAGAGTGLARGVLAPGAAAGAAWGAAGERRRAAADRGRSFRTVGARRGAGGVG